MFKTCMFQIKQKLLSWGWSDHMIYCTYPTNMASYTFNTVMFTTVSRCIIDSPFSVLAFNVNSMVFCYYWSALKFNVHAVKRHNRPWAPLIVSPNDLLIMRPGYISYQFIWFIEQKAFLSCLFWGGIYQKELTWHIRHAFGSCFRNQQNNICSIRQHVTEMMLTLNQNVRDIHLVYYHDTYISTLSTNLGSRLWCGNRAHY